MASSIPSASTKGFQAALSYDQHRPSYPSEAVDSLLKHLQLDGLKGARIIDLAAGTGKFTKLLVDREEQYEIIAVEPNDGMRAEVEMKQFKGVKVLDGVASSMTEVESQCIDAVVAAQVSQVFPSNGTAYEILTSGAFFGNWSLQGSAASSLTQVSRTGISLVSTNAGFPLPFPPAFYDQVCQQGSNRRNLQGFNSWGSVWDDLEH